MAASVRSTSSATASLASTFSVSKPAGTADGDLLVAFEAAGGLSDITAPTGWTKLTNLDYNGTTGDLACFYKVASSEGASWTFNGSGTGNSAVYCFCITGTTATAPENTNTTNSGTGTTATATGLTTAQNNEVLLQAYAADGALTTITPAAGTDLGTISSSPYFDAAHQTQASAGATGNRTASLSNNTTWGAMLVAVPSANPGGGASVTPSTLALTTTGFAPTIRLNKIATPTTKALALTTFAPSVVRGTSVSPAAASLTLTAYAPTVRLSTIVSPAARALTLTGFAPTVYEGIHGISDGPPVRAFDTTERRQGATRTDSVPGRAAVTETQRQRG